MPFGLLLANAPFCLVLVALRLHRRGDKGTRQRKYRLLFLSAIFSFQFPLAIAVLQYEQARAVMAWSILKGRLIYLGTVPIAWLAASLLIRLFRGRPWKLYSALVKMGRLAGIAIVIPGLMGFVSTFFLVFVYLFARFRVVEVLAKRPIVYLRSYGSSNASMAYTRIVSPVVAQFGVVVTLGRESANEFALTISPEASPLIVRPAENMWRPEVLALVERCAVVLIDTSTPTEGVLWELETARSRLDAGQIAVLRSGESVQMELDSSGTWGLQYTLDDTGVAESRKRLQEWLRVRMTAPGP